MEAAIELSLFSPISHCLIFYGTKALVYFCIRHHRTKALAKSLQKAKRIWIFAAIFYISLSVNSTGYGKDTLGARKFIDERRSFVDHSFVRWV